MKVRLKGGPGSGHRGHAGRPGQVGGSLPGVGGVGLQPGQALGSWGTGLGGSDTIADMKASDHLAEGVEGRELDPTMGPTQMWEFPIAGERERVKARVMDAVVDHANVAAKSTGMSPITYDEVNLVVKQWAFTSNGSDMRSLSLQEAAAEEFGFEMSTWQKSLITKNRAAPPSNRTKPLMTRDRERAILRGMYNNTQEELRKAGYKSGDQVKLFRGVKFDTDPKLSDGATTQYNGNGMESWSVDLSTAKGFAMPDEITGGWGASLGISIPMENVFSTAKTGFGCLTEGEFVIFGNISNTKVSVEYTIYDEGM